MLYLYQDQPARVAGAEPGRERMTGRWGASEHNTERVPLRVMPLMEAKWGAMPHAGATQEAEYG